MKKFLCLLNLLTATFIASQNLQAETISASDKRVGVMGRTQALDDGSLRFAYPGVSLFINIEAASLQMTAHSTTGNTWLDVMVDNNPPKQIQLEQTAKTIELFRFSEPGKYSVRIVNRNETWQGISTISGFSFDSGKLLSPPAQPKRKLLFLGDSVTCAEMIDRVPGEKSDPSWSNARESYGMLTATALNAQVQLVCYGGRGLVRSWNGKSDELNLPDFYPLTIPDQANPVSWNKSAYEPDLIVSAIGTNDFSQGIPEREAYVIAYVKLVNQLLKDYPRAHIALTEGAILNGDKKAVLIDYIRETISRVNDTRVHQVTSPHYPGDEQDAHPTKEQHAAMAADLAPQLKVLMSW
jgi:lysophospholipase L1-like esterase